MLFGTRARGLEVAQENWLLQHAQAGGYGYVMIMTNYRIILVEGSLVDEINTMTVEELCESAEYWNARKGLNWEDVVKCL